MKRWAGWLVILVLALICAGAAADVKVDEINFPDPSFRGFIKDNYLDAGEDTLTDEKLKKIEDMDCSEKGIWSLKGIHFFYALEILDCSGNKLVTLDLSGNPELKTVDCRGNNLLSLTLSSSLTTVLCQGNEMDWLDLSGCAALKKLVNKTKPKTVDDYIRYRSDAAELQVDKGVYLAVTNEVLINWENFPDEVFRDLVSTFDTDGSGSLKKAEIAAVKKLNCPKKGIASLQGIEYLTALTQLNCSGNLLRKLDLSGNEALVTVDCSGNEIEELNTAGLPSLTTLDCSENNILALQLHSSKKLTALDCRRNNLTTLNLTRNTELKTLDCGENALITLGLSTNTALKTVKCDHNKLTMLGLTANGKLKTLWCQHNNLTELSLSKNPDLTTLMVDHNPLVSLNIRPASALVKLVKNQTAKKDAERQCIFYSQGGHALYCDETLILITGEGDSTTVDGNVYELNHTALTATFLKPKSRKVSKLVIPDKISAYGRSYTVNTIGDEACRGMTSLTSVTIGSKVEFIGKKAFFDCGKIKNMYIKTTKLSAKRVGEKAFAGIPASATYKCPASKLAEYSGLLVDRGASAKSRFIIK